MPHSAASRARANNKRAANRRVAKRVEQLINHLPDLWTRLWFRGINKLVALTPEKVYVVRRDQATNQTFVRRYPGADGRFITGVTLRIYRNDAYQRTLYLDIHIPFVGPKYGITCSAWCAESKPNYYTNFLVDYLDKMFVETAHSLLMARMKEELIAAVWHPRRVEAWLETGGWAAVEDMAGEERSGM